MIQHTTEAVEATLLILESPGSKFNINSVNKTFVVENHGQTLVSDVTLIRTSCKLLYIYILDVMWLVYEPGLAHLEQHCHSACTILKIYFIFLFNY